MMRYQCCKYDRNMQVYSAKSIRLNIIEDINKIRRKITRFFSNLFVNESFSEDVFDLNITQVKTILIARPNHRQ